MKILKNIYKVVAFYLRNTPIELRYSTLSFSQFGEDLALNSLLKKKSGYYIDVGAYHPFSYSNTYFFYRKGWQGINIEPNPHGFKLLERYRKRDKNIPFGVSSKEEKLQFIPESTFSRLVDPATDAPLNKKIIDIYVKPLSKILEEYLPNEQEIDFISIDCEGHDLNVLQSNDWQRFRPEYLIVEDHHPIEQSKIIPFMVSVGYIHIFDLELTRFFINKWNNNI